MPKRRVVAGTRAEFAVGAVQARARPPLRAGCCQFAHLRDTSGRWELLCPGKRVTKAHLQGDLAPRKLQRCRVREFACCPLCLEILNQVFFNHVEVREFCLADVAGFRDMVAHPARKLHALLLEVVEKPLDALRRLADLRACQHACGGVCHDQLQLFHRRAPGATDEDWHFAKILAPFCDQSPNRSRAPVAGDEAVLAVLRARDRRRVHNAGERDGIFEFFELGLIDCVKVRVVADQIVNVGLHEFALGVRLGHRLHLLGKNA